MPRLSVHKPDVADPPNDHAAHGCAAEVDGRQAGPGALVPPLLVDISGLARLLARSVPSLHRDDAAGRLPAAVRIGGSKRWRYSEIVRWVEAGCPARAEWGAINCNSR
jgi:predicted DNA-binding transcriptional regulator AlpA